MKKLLTLALAALATALTTTATAATPTVVWNSDFGTTSKVGTDGKTYTLDVQSNEVTTDGNLKITQGVAPKISLPSSFGQNITVVMKYSGFVAPEADTSILSVGQTSGCNDIGLYVVSNGTQLAGYYNKTLNFGKVTTTIPESGYIAMSYSVVAGEGNGVHGYVGTASEGAVTYSGRAGTDGLKFTDATYYLTSVNLGGSAVSSSLAPFTGLVIEQVAIYTDRCTSSAALPHQDFVATTSGTVTWSSLPWDGMKGSTWSDSGLNELTLIVTDDTTLTLDSNVTATNLIIDVASGKTLTISGNYSITTADKTYFCGGCGTVSTTKTQVFGSTPRVYVAYPSVWTLTNSDDDTSEKTVDCSNITGNGSIELSSGSSNKWRVLPWTAGNMWTNSLGLVASEKNGVILSDGERCWELGSLSGSYGIRSDYGTSAYGKSQRQVRFTQSRDTTWSGTFHNDRVNNVYVAGAADATAKTLTIASASTSADNPLTVEASGSVKLTGKWAGDLTVYGEFGGAGTVESATTVTIADGATIRADWGVATLAVAPTIGAGTNFTVIVSSLPAKDTATQIFAGSSFTAATYDGVCAALETSDGASKTYAEVSVQSDGVYVTVTDAVLDKKVKALPKYVYEMNGSFESTGTSALTVTGDFTDDFTADAVLDLGSDAGSHYGDSGFSFSPDITYAADWTIITYAMTPAANQTIFALGGTSGTEGLLGLRYAGSNEVKAFTTSGTDLTGVTLESDPTAGFHLYAIVYSASAGTIKMSVDGGEFSTAASFTPGSGAQWQFGGVHTAAISGIAENASSGQIDSFRMYSYALTAAELQAILTSDFPTVAKIGDGNFPTLGVAVADRATADTVVEIVANCTETAAIALETNLVLTVADGSSFTVSAPISGDYSLTKQGDGTLTLAGENTYTGGTTASAGVLTRGSTTAFGSAGSTVSVADGATVDLGGSISGSSTYTFNIAGAGATGREYALTGAASTTMTESGIAGIELSADATISAMTFGDVSLGKCNVTLNGFTLTTTGSVYGSNVKFYGTGSVVIASGTYTANKWNNWGKEATLQIDNGAVYVTEAIDSNDRCAFTNIVNNGTLSMNGSYTMNINGGTYSGTGTINNLRLQAGSTLDLSANTTELATSVFIADGAFTLALGSRTLTAGDVILSASSSMTLDMANVVVTCDTDLEAAKLAIEKVGNTIAVVDTSLPAWTTGSGTWSATSYNGAEGTYDYSAAIVTFTGDGTETEAAVTIPAADTNKVATLAFNNEVTPITISDGAITAGDVTKTGAAAATVNSALTLTGGGVSVGSGAILALNNVSGTVNTIALDGTGDDAGALTFSVPADTTATVGSITGSGAVTLAGDGTVALTDVSETTTININSGTLQVASSSQTFCGTNVVASGATFDFNGHADGFPVFILNGGSLVNNSANLGTGNRTLGNNGITLAADSYIGGTGNFGLIASNHAKFPLALNGNVLHKTGADTIYLSQAEDTTSGGTFAIEAGTVQIVRNVALTGDTVAVSNGATLSVSGNYTLTAANLVGAGTVSAPTSISGMLDLTGGLSVSGSVTLGDGAVIRLPQNATLPFQVTSGTLTVENGATVTIQDYTGTAQSLWYIEGNTIAQRTVVASIGETTYYDLAEALDDLTENCTLVILADELSLTSEIATAITLDLNGHTVSSTGSSTPTLQRNVTVVDNAATAGKLWFVNGLSGSEGDSFQLAKTANIDLVGVYGAASGTTLTLVEGYAVFAYPVTTVELVIDADSNITVSAATATALAGTAGVDATATALNATQANDLTVWQNTILGITSSSDSEAEDITVSITMVDGAPVITTTCGTVTGVTLSEPSKSVTVGNLVATVKLQSRADLSTGSWADVKSTDTHIGLAEFYRVSVSFSNTAE